MDYSATRSSVYGTIKRNGKAVVLRRPAAGTFAEATGTLTPGSPTDYSTYAVEDRYDAAHIDGTLVQRGDRKFIVAALTTAKAAIPTPSTSDEFYVGTTAGTKLAIVSVSPIMPATTMVAFEVQCRG